MGHKMNLIPRSYLAIVFFLSTCIISTAAFSLDLAKEQELTAKRIFDSVLSPFCPGRVLSDCPSSSATDLKDELRQRIINGESEEQIMQYLFGRFGTQISAVPQTSGVGLIAWLAPISFLLFGGVGLMLWLRANIRRSQKTTS